MIAMLEKNYMTVEQAASEAGCTVSYVRQLIRANIILAERFGRRAWVIPVNQLEKLQNSPTGKKGKPRIGKKKS
jgi:excisionase family DNA binding protein